MALYIYVVKYCGVHNHDNKLIYTVRLIPTPADFCLNGIFFQLNDDAKGENTKVHFFNCTYNMPKLQEKWVHNHITWYDIAWHGRDFSIQSNIIRINQTWKQIKKLIYPVPVISYSLNPFTVTQQAQNICIILVQCWTSVEDVGLTLYKCYTKVLCLLGDDDNFFFSSVSLADQITVINWELNGGLTSRFAKGWSQN